ncbi:unnamed protein product [Chrysodeixis includens]|uniref:Pacifastin domain-containing protein n=1 Tax=Chrysodeixis includens TaxID=689277 RepID=A0A9N8Q0K5_CHRIL|nr:unnamed protein product [Chrysodeixis includens]
MLAHQQPVAEKVWSERCTRNTIALNDCNWCHCDARSQFSCQARVCSEVDMFGHFNDAIREMDVGMEGKGVWRSDNSACEAGVHYRKNELMCVCTEDGTWPNPVCRDIFQVLHAVEVTDHEQPLANHTCQATKLYLVGCNVCYCPSTEHLDPNLCTKRKCSVSENVERSHTSNEMIEEIYATCTPTKRYKLGCQTCVCLRNNRLLCDNCTDTENLDLIMQNTACSNKSPSVSFKKDCNFCHCDKKETIYCTAKKCLRNHTEIRLPKMKYEEVTPTTDDYNCIPGSKYEKECNSCHCFMIDGVKYFGCTLKSCSRTERPKHDCVEGTTYQVNCLICHCDLINGVKTEYCTIDETCKADDNDKLKSLSSMHGYCEPMHFYQQDCNKCRCMADGKTVACTSKLCLKKKKKDELQIVKNRASENDTMIVEFIPFIQKDNFCPRGHTYSVDCNVCYCMETGNAICTTKQC